MTHLIDVIPQKAAYLTLDFYLNTMIDQWNWMPFIKEDGRGYS